MKKVLTILCVMIMAAAMLGGCSGKAEETKVPEATGETAAASEGVQQDTQASSDALTDKKSLTIGFDADFAPYGFMDDQGEYVGFDIDLAQEVCDRLSWELIKQPLDWDSKDMELSSGSIDCIWNGFTYNGREDDYTWSSPYVDNSQVFVVGKDSGIKTAADLAGKVVNVQAGSSALTSLQEDTELTATFADMIQVPEYNTAFMNLEAGAADAVALDIGVAKYQMSSREGSFVMLEEPLSTEVYAIGFLKGNEALRDVIQEQLDAMASDGTLAEIAQKWELTDSVILGK